MVVRSTTHIKLISAAPNLDLHHYTVIYVSRCIVCLELILFCQKEIVGDRILIIKFMTCHCVKDICMMS